MFVVLFNLSSYVIDYILLLFYNLEFRDCFVHIPLVCRAVLDCQCKLVFI